LDWTANPADPFEPNQADPPAYAAVIVCVPDALAAGVYETEQFADLTDPDNAHAPLPPNDPDPEVENETSPGGGLEAAGPASATDAEATDAEHTTDCPATTDEGVHDTDVAVDDASCSSKAPMSHPVVPSPGRGKPR
jgi:hypothetical protein